jgi:hypothetical protein
MVSVNGFWESSFVFATLSGGVKRAQRNGRRCFGCDGVVQPAAAMLASRRQLCSSRHNVRQREREVEARRQACVGNRGFSWAAGRQGQQCRVEIRGVGWCGVEWSGVWSVCR